MCGQKTAQNMIFSLDTTPSSGLPAVITLAAHFPDRTTDEVPIPEACKRLEDKGAAVVGLNCSRGPDIMMPLIQEIKNVCKVGSRFILI